jgi:hypothetical protein
MPGKPLSTIGGKIIMKFEAVDYLIAALLLGMIWLGLTS